jgi:glycosyltransferase involved in cell wall biosynthesis
VLAVTRIFPNRVEPLACAFNRQQWKALSTRCELQVLAVVPHLFGASLLGDRTRVGRLGSLPRRDEVDGVAVLHPRAPYVPRGGALFAALNAPLYVAGLLPYVRALRGQVDVVLGAYLYPDACAAAALAKMLEVPYVVKTHGTDVNLVAGWRTVRPWIGATLRHASAVVGVSRPMMTRLVELGARPDLAHLVPNGVDRATFHPRDRREVRRALGLPVEGDIVLFVGRFAKEKGLRELMRAIGPLVERRAARGQRPVSFVFVGDGPMRSELEERAATGAPEGAHGTIAVVGERPLADVARFVAAADVLALPSWAEGTPNVVLEALASGRPVVATAVGGLVDLIRDGETGYLVAPRAPAALVDALDRALDTRWSEAKLCAAAPPSWEESADQLYRVLLSSVAAEAIQAA